MISFCRTVVKRLGVTSLLMLFLLPVTAVQVAASQMSKTYTINASSLSNYELSGSVTVDGSVVSSWYHPAWSSRHQITINHELIAENLHDFPVLLRLNDLSLAGARDDRHDLLITASDGTTKLAHEREDNTTLWVKVPEISSTEDTILYLYYGNPQATDQQDAAAVWTNGYAGVYHLNDDPGNTVNDATRNQNNGRSVGGMTRNDSLQEGMVEQSLRFDGSNDYIDVAASYESLESWTIGGWIKPTPTSVAGQEVIMKLGSHAFQIDRNSSSVPPLRSLRYYNGSTTYDATQTIDFNVWQHVLISRSGSSITFYKNGDAVQSRTYTGGSQPPLDYLAWYSSAAHYWKGGLDELRVSSVARTPAWIRAEYTNQCNCEDFLTISDTVETNHTTSSRDISTSTIQLKPDRPLSFTALSSFVPNASDTVTYQLSNNGGKSWLFYTKDGWKSANPSNPNHRSSANDIHGHLSSFPQGDGKLLWRAYLPSGTSLDSIKIDYLPGPAAGTSALLTGTTSPATSLQDFRVQSLNTLFWTAFDRTPTPGEWTHWVTRMLSEGKPLDAWLGAMEWQASFGQ